MLSEISKNIYLTLTILQEIWKEREHFHCTQPNKTKYHLHASKLINQSSVKRGACHAFPLYCTNASTITLVVPWVYPPSGGSSSSFPCLTYQNPGFLWFEWLNILLTFFFSPHKDTCFVKEKFYTKHLLETARKTLFRSIAIWERLLQ